MGLESTKFFAVSVDLKHEPESRVMSSTGIMNYELRLLCFKHINIKQGDRTGLATIL